MDPPVQFRRCHKKGRVRRGGPRGVRGDSGETGKFVASGVGQEGEDADGGAGGELSGGGGACVADDGGSLIEAAGPAGAGNVSENEALAFDTCGFKDGAGDFDEVGPAGGYADEAAVQRGEPGIEPGACGAYLEGDKFDAGGEKCACSVCLAGAAKRDGCKCYVGPGAIFKRGAGDWESRELADFGEEDFANFVIGLDEEEMIGRRRGKPLGHAATNVGCGHVELADSAEESSNVLVKNLLRSGGRCGVVFDVDAATVAELGPSFACELAVSRADRVGMDAEAASEFASAGKTVAGTEISRENGQDHLRDQLAVDGNFADGREPESHGSLGAILAATDERGNKGTSQQGNQGET